MIKIKIEGTMSEVHHYIMTMALGFGYRPDTARATAASVVAAAPAVVETETPATEAPEPKAKKARKAKAPETKEVENGEEQENGEVGEQESAESDREDDGDDNKTVAAKANGKETADALKLKVDTIAKLRKAHADGKGKEVKALLVKYGDGAKSFAEMDPAAFRSIVKEIKAGVLG